LHPRRRDDTRAKGKAHRSAIPHGQDFADAPIADTALYLNSDLAAAGTGVTIPIDAGHMLLTGFNHAPVK
jgi:enoyl-[acyl-carrier-protein] reductase (NADH)